MDVFTRARVIRLFSFVERWNGYENRLDRIWHLLINVLRILKPEISQFAWQTIQVIGPNLLYFNQ